MMADRRIFQPRFQRAMLRVGLGVLTLEAVVALSIAYTAQAPSRTVMVNLRLDPPAFEAPARRGVVVPLTILEPPPRPAPVVLPPESAALAYRGHVDELIGPKALRPLGDAGSGDRKWEDLLPRRRDRPVARALPPPLTKSDGLFRRAPGVAGDVAPSAWGDDSRQMAQATIDQPMAEISPGIAQKQRTVDALSPQSGMVLQPEDQEQRWSAQSPGFVERMRRAVASLLLAEGEGSSWQAQRRAVEQLDRAMGEPCDGAACNTAAWPGAWANGGEIAIGSFNVHAIFDYSQHLNLGSGQPRYLPYSLTADARSLTALFQDIDYALYEGTHIPGIFLRRLPHDIASLPQADDRKMLFVRAILPLIVHENEKNLTIRRRVLALAPDIETRAALTAKDQEFIDEILGHFRLPRFDLGELLARIDIVPPSLALAQAAEESGWGTSRMVREGNALFGEVTWRIIGAAENARIVREQRLFEDLATGVAAYMRNLNTHRAYEAFRRRRAAIRAAGGIPDGPSLTPYLQRYSERGDSYVQTIRNLIALNNLFTFDRVKFRNAPNATESVNQDRRSQ